MEFKSKVTSYGILDTVLTQAVKDYLECAEWCGMIQDDPNPGFNTSGDYDEVDVVSWGPSSVSRVITDVTAFLLRCDEEGVLDALIGSDLLDIGGNFYLTRCGHGTGFWDRGLGELGRKLTAISKEFGSEGIVECTNAVLRLL